MSTPTPSPAVAPLRLANEARPAQPRSDAAVLRGALSAAGSSIAALARSCVVSETRAGQWCDDEESASISLKHVLNAPSSVRRELGLALLTEEDAHPAHLSALDHLARLTAEAGDVSRAVIEAGADVNDQEAERIDRELAELGAAVERARRDLRARRAR